MAPPSDRVEYFDGVGYVSINTSEANDPIALDFELTRIQGRLEKILAEHEGRTLPADAKAEWDRLIDSLSRIASERDRQEFAFERQKQALADQFADAFTTAVKSAKPLILEGGVQVAQVIASCDLCHSDSMGSYDKRCDNETCLGLSDEEWAWRDIEEWWMDPKTESRDDFDRLDTTELEKRVWRALTNPPRHSRTYTVIR